MDQLRKTSELEWIRYLFNSYFFKIILKGKKSTKCVLNGGNEEEKEKKHYFAYLLECYTESELDWVIKNEVILTFEQWSDIFWKDDL